MDEEEKTALLSSLKLVIFLLLFSLLFLFASFYIGGAAYIFAIVNSFWFLGAASQAPGFRKNEKVPPVIRDWKIVTFLIFVLYALLVFVSGYENIYIPITFCTKMLACLIGLNFWVLSKN